MLDKRPWWQSEFLATENNQKYIKWLENQAKIKEIKDKERSIINGFNAEIQKKRDEIDRLYKEIKEMERMCNECLVKIYIGDSGLMDLVGEKNS